MRLVGGGLEAKYTEVNHFKFESKVSQAIYELQFTVIGSCQEKLNGKISSASGMEIQVTLSSLWPSVPPYGRADRVTAQGIVANTASMFCLRERKVRDLQGRHSMLFGSYK